MSTRTITWQPLSTSPEIFLIIQELVERLHDHALLKKSIETAQRQSRVPQYVGWSDYSAASGYAGLAILDAYLDACFPGHGYDCAGHDALQRATAGNLDAVSASLAGGLSGLAFAVTLLSRQGERYGQLQAALDQRILELVSQQVRAMEAQHGLASYQYDVISGLAGVAAYLLCRTCDPACRAMLCEVGRGLVALSYETDGLPHWYVPQELIMQDTLQPIYTAGLMDSGLAHGIAGPLAALALMYRQGEIVAGHVEAMERMANWLLEHRCDDAYGMNWSAMYPVGGIGDPPQPARTAWCYGAPGIGRALWLAGDALGRSAYQEAALEALTVVCRKPVQEHCPNLCHGVAGLLQIMLRFWHDTHLPQFEKAASELLARLIELYDPQSLVGYRDHEYDVRLDRPDLLNGSIGVTLALLSASSPVEPVWDRLFLLA